MKMILIAIQMLVLKILIKSLYLLIFCKILIIKAIPKFILNAIICDSSDSIWVSIFHENAEKLLGNINLKINSHYFFSSII